VTFRAAAVLPNLRKWKKFLIAPLAALTCVARASAVLVCSAMAVSTLAPSAKADFVFNGNFQTWTGGTAGSPSQLADSGTGGYTALTNWVTGDGSALLAFLFAPGTADTTGDHDVRFNDTFNLWGPGANGGGVANGLTAASPNGGNFVALDAAPAYRGVGISQNLTGLTVGAQYRVSFYWAAAQQHGFDGATTESVQVGFGGRPVQTTATFNNASHGFSGWMFQTFNFLADATTNEKLSFLALGGPDGLPPFVLLDGVSVVAVPEPGTVALTLGAMGMLWMLGVWRARRRLRTVVIEVPRILK
jgi:hypothetical protein